MRVLVQVVDSGGFSRAAERLGLANATVTTAVQSLEAHLGTQLLQRTTRRVALTDDGRIYVERVRALLSQLDELDASMGDARNVPRGPLRVAMPVELGPLLAGAALARFLGRHPRVRMTLLLDDGAVGLADQRLDAAMRVGAMADSALVARPLGELREMLCAAPAYLARAGRPQHPRELAEHDCLGYFSAVQKRVPPWRLTHGDQTHLHEPRGPLVLNHAETLADAAAAGMGVACLLEPSLRAHLADGRLVPVLEDWQPAPVPVNLVVASRTPSAKVRAFGDYMQELMEERAAGR